MTQFQIPPRPELLGQWKLTEQRFGEWLHEELFSPSWFLLLFLMAATVTLWWKLSNKARLGETTLFTMIVLLFILVLDELGEELTLWYYPVDLFFLFPPTMAIDISCMPLLYMVVYQKFRSWRSYLIATLFMSLLFCFVFEPVAVRAGIYVMLKWKSYYGYPIYSFIGLCAKFIVDKLLAPPRTRP